jgi:type IV pilus assembly protein PilB
MTCEDPIEYEIDGVNQSQVNEKVGLTFVTQLRAILRQDPDIIMVGEVRDGETAETAIRAALTGHLVLSTLHCNDAPSAVPRLLDMDIDPFLLSTCLIGVISQRLLRVLCPHCRVNAAPDAEEADFLDFVLNTNETPMLWRPVGCAKCNHTGYKGRTSVHEIMPMPGAIAKAIALREPVERIREIAAQYGYQPMRTSAMELVLNGTTSLAEARRQVFFEAYYETSQEELAIRRAS